MIKLICVLSIAFFIYTLIQLIRAKILLALLKLVIKDLLHHNSDEPCILVINGKRIDI
jgi:hypothetical protein